LSQLKKSVVVCLVLGFLSVGISFVLAFIIGVYFLSDRFAGNDYYGTIIYYFWIAVPVVIIIPFLFSKRIYNLKISGLLLTAMGTGALYSFVSIMVLNLYLDNMDFLPARQGFVLLIAYGFEEIYMYGLGLIMSTSVMLAGKIKRGSIWYRLK
jgi:hypothetical protein